MKALFKQSIGFILSLMILSGTGSLWAQSNTDDYITVSGVVRDKQSKKKLEYVNITIPGSNVGTVTNSDGEFTLKVKAAEHPKALGVSHVGYTNTEIPLGEKKLTEQTIWMSPYVNLLNEVTIHAQNPLIIVQEAIRKIPLNYEIRNNMLTGFYREIAQKGKRYVNIPEAVIDIYKTPYAETVDRDRVQVLKGRRLLSQKAKDTLAVKLLGGPTMAIYLDVVKNPDFLFDAESLGYYDFRMEDPTSIANRSQFVISFRPRVIMPYALCYGKLYIDKERLSFTRAEFNLSMDDRNKATQAILRRKPFGLRFKPLEVSYLVAYEDRGNVTYLKYMRNNIRFKCDWKKKLFSTNYTILSEMVVTDHKEDNVSPIPFKAAFKLSQAFSDKVTDFANENFWGSYNIIEPTESLENAVVKLRKQQK